MMRWDLTSLLSLDDDWDKPWDDPLDGPVSSLQDKHLPTRTKTPWIQASARARSQSLSRKETLNTNTDYHYFGQLVLEKLQLKPVKRQRSICSWFPVGTTKSFRIVVDRVTFTGFWCSRSSEPFATKCQEECSQIILNAARQASFHFKEEIDSVKANQPPDLRDQAFERQEQELRRTNKFTSS